MPQSARARRDRRGLRPVSEPGLVFLEALSLLKQLPKRRLEADEPWLLKSVLRGSEVISYNASISACEKGGQWQLALALLKEALQSVQVGC